MGRLQTEWVTDLQTEYCVKTITNPKEQFECQQFVFQL